MTSELAALILSICVNGSSNLDDACVDYLNNCSVGPGGSIEQEVVRNCVKKYADGDRYKYDEDDEER